VPLYSWVKQEYIPSDVDEAEFQVTVTAPEGTSLAAMDEVMRLVEAEIRSIPAVRFVLATAGGFTLGNVNIGNAYVRIAPHEERVFSLGRLWR
jgi:hydrophobic/amphiphilic exporter-1 (mainly G- bacteria), HAE1 family